jgi:hypothetical protein
MVSEPPLPWRVFGLFVEIWGAVFAPDYLALLPDADWFHRVVWYHLFFDSY